MIEGKRCTVVVTILEGRADAARRAIARLPASADMVELRLDQLAAQDWEGVVASAARPVLATCRPPAHGGTFPGTEEERVSLLRRALEVGAARVDVEVGTAAADLVEDLPPERLLLSIHDFHPGTATLARHVERLLGSPRPLALKLAYTARHASDCLAGRDILRRAVAEARRLALVPMGEPGLPGRLLAPAWGAAAAYAAPDGKEPAAPGQPTLFQLAELYDVGGIGPDTVLTGLLGWPISASLSPWMHNRGAQAAGLDCRYLPFPEADAADFLLNLEAWGLTGVSVTAPHKESVLPWLDEIDAAGRACGAVNTLTLKQGRLTGGNTDAGAAVAIIRAGLAGPELQGKEVSILGAGGAARAVGWAAAAAGARVTLFNRDEGRGRRAAAAIGAQRRPWEELATAADGVLVNATPVGTWPHTQACPLPVDRIQGDLVFDLVANPEATLLLDEARRRGVAAVSGIEMLVRQGEAQFELWHGAPPPPGAFAAAAREGLRRMQS